MSVLLLFLMSAVMVGFSGGFVYALFEKDFKKKRLKKHNEEMDDFVIKLSEDKIIPVLKERNVTSFIVKEKRMYADITYNQKTIVVSIKADIYNDGYYENIYGFEYDLKNDFLIKTSRESETYLALNKYEDIRHNMKTFTDKMISYDWAKKASQPLKKEVHKEQSTHQEIESLRNKAKAIMEFIDLLTDKEKQELQEIVTNDIEKTVAFLNRLSVEDRKKYEPVIVETLKEIDKKVENVMEVIEERKYKKFKEKIKRLAIENQESDEQE